MRLHKVADEKTAPSWAFGSEDLNEFKKQTISIEDIERINATDANNVNDETIINECDEIEKCAASGKPYHYSSQWAKKDINHLKEYAIACGLDLNQFKGVNPHTMEQELNIITANVESTKTVRTASNTMEIGDPFHLDERADTSHMDVTEWEKVSIANTLSDQPNMKGAIVALRGSDNIEINSDVNPAINQNSITNPHAIEDLVESKVMDTGERLRKEKADRIAAVAENKKQWEQDKIDEMVHKNIVAKGNVFPTESMVAQSGIRDSDSGFGVYSKSDPKNLPEKTQGEMIAEANIAHKASISRESQTDQWENMQKAPTRSISEDFSSSLAKLLKK